MSTLKSMSRRMRPRRASGELKLAFEPAGQLFNLQPYCDEELAEERVLGADLVEAHLVDQLLEDHGIVCEEVDAPLPVVVPDRSSDDLLDPFAVSAADHAVLVHHPLPLGKVNHVPVLLVGAFAVHGIEAEVLCFGNGGPEAWGHGLGATLEGCGNFCVPLRRMLLEALRGCGFVGFVRG